MRKPIFLLLFALSMFQGQAQITDPIVTNWRLNTTNHMAGGILTGVERVDYTPNDVFITTSGVPWYYDPNNSSVNKAKDQNFVFGITRVPAQNTGTASSTLHGGQLGVYLNGSTFFNPEDARSYQNGNTWHQTAYHFEYTDLDSTWGHSTPAMGGNAYHHHVIDKTTCNRFDNTKHSPIIGYAFDGYPVYGPFGYTTATDSASGISRMTPSYQIRSIADRTTLPDGTVLQASQYGPAIGGQFPLGIYREDFEYKAGSGTLDDHNGRFCKTPEYPNGIYAYFATVKADGTPLYPFHIGSTFYGVVTQGNTGPLGGKNTVPGGAVKYVPTNVAIQQAMIGTFSIYPNPSQNIVNIETETATTIVVLDMAGKQVATMNAKQGNNQLDIAQFPQGVYLLSATNGQASWTSRLVKN